MTDAVAAPPRWLFGPKSDLLLGCGGAYAIVFVLMFTAGDAVRAAVPFGLLPLLILVTGVPHYGATLLRVYERREDRRAYRVLALWATLAVYAWFAAGVYDLAVGSWLLTLYLTWSPWHYTGQNYGIGLMFLHRRGVSVSPLAKRWIYVSFLSSFAIAFVGSHAAIREASYAPVSLSGSSYEFLRLGIPEQWAALVLLCATAVTVGATGVAVVLLRRQGSWRDLAPTLALMGTQALWFSVPVLSRVTGLGDERLPFDPGASQYAFLWVAMGHSVQYLWVTTYYALSSDRSEHRTPYLGKTLVAGGAIWGLPLLLFGPDMLGVRAHDAGLGLLVASAVNVHHFILDGAIWKLRDGRVARVLLRSHDASDGTAVPDLFRQPWIGRAARAGIVAAGITYLVFSTVGTLELEYGVRRAMNPPDFDRLRTAATRLSWVARDQPDVRYNLGMHAFRSGDLATARREIERSLELSESSTGWEALGLIEQRDGRSDDALSAWAAALALDPDSVPALAGSAAIWERRGDLPRARAALERAVLLAPERVDLRERLDRL